MVAKVSHFIIHDNSIQKVISFEQLTRQIRTLFRYMQQES